MTMLHPAPVTAPVRRLTESRPPLLERPPTLEPGGLGGDVGPWQPLLPVEPDAAHVDPVDHQGPGEARVRTVRAAWTARPDPTLPDAAGWSGALAVAVVEALLARRPVAQLNRWLSEEVLACVTLQQRRRLARPAVSAVPTLVSGRVQHPAARVAEVAVVLRVGRRPLILAMRLEGLGERWACTALELGPRPEPGARS